MNTSFWILLALGLVLITAAMAVKTIAFFKAEPKVTVDYLEEYNKISKPDGFDANENAYEFYKKAYEVFVQPSETAKKALEKWYTDINEAEKTELQEWLVKNIECMEYLKEGNRKKYFWAEIYVNMSPKHQKYFEELEAETKKNEIVFWPGSNGARLLEQRARVAAMDGHFVDVLSILIECWKIGQHYTNPKMLWHIQCGGMGTEERALEMAFKILDSYTLDANTLKLWQESWQKIFDEDKYHPGFKSDHLLYYGYVQKYFAYHSKGKGRLAWKMAKEFDDLHDRFYFKEDGNVSQVLEREGPNPYYYCFFGPTSNEVKGLVDYFFEHYESYNRFNENTPWSMYYHEQKFKKEIEEWKAKHPLPKMFFFPGLKPDWTYYHRLKAKSDALITVIALLRFKADHGHYPKNLEFLRPREGFRYLAKMPQDPFSEGPLVYHWLVDDFELYSVGPDFKDDSGKRTRGIDPFGGDNKGDDVFWPPFRLNRENVKFYPHRDRPEL